MYIIYTCTWRWSCSSETQWKHASKWIHCRHHRCSCRRRCCCCCFCSRVEHVTMSCFGFYIQKYIQQLLWSVTMSKASPYRTPDVPEIKSYAQFQYLFFQRMCQHNNDNSSYGRDAMVLPINLTEEKRFINWKVNSNRPLSLPPPSLSFCLPQLCIRLSIDLVFIFTFVVDFAIQSS